jgi:hypothetical protein
VGVKHTAPQNVVLVFHKNYHAQMAADALIFVKTRIKESLYQKEIVVRPNFSNNIQLKYLLSSRNKMKNKAEIIVR